MLEGDSCLRLWRRFLHLVQSRAAAMALHELACLMLEVGAIVLRCRHHYLVLVRRWAVDAAADVVDIVGLGLP